MVGVASYAICTRAIGYGEGKFPTITPNGRVHRRQQDGSIRRAYEHRKLAVKPTDPSNVARAYGGRARADQEISTIIERIDVSPYEFKTFRVTIAVEIRGNERFCARNGG